MQPKDKKLQDWIAQLKKFLSKPRGIAIAVAAVLTVCIVLGIGISHVVFGDDKPMDVVTATETPEDADDSTYDAQADMLNVNQFTGTILPETEDAGQEYVDNTLFVGDSNTARYMNYGFVTLDNGIGVIGMNAGQITTLPSVKFKGNKSLVTIDKAIPEIQPQRVIFAFGTNDLTSKPETYIETYEKAIKKCYDAYPYFDVIVSAIPPVDRYRDYTYISMQNVDKFNAALVGMCEKNGWKFLNTTEVLKDEETGFGKTDYTIYDGLHLSKEGVEEVFNYVRTHAYEAEDRRPKPLKAKAERGETPPDLIMKDPVKHDGPHATPTATPTATPAVVQVVFKASEGGTIQGVKEQNVPYGGTCETVVAVPNEGYTFEKWSCTIGHIDADAIGWEKLSFTVPGSMGGETSITVVAHFVQDQATATPTVEPTAVPTAEPTATPPETETPVAPETSPEAETPVVPETPPAPETPVVPETPTTPEAPVTPETPEDEMVNP